MSLDWELIPVLLCSPQGLAPKEQDSAEAMGNAVEDEINNTAEVPINSSFVFIRFSMLPVLFPLDI